MTAAVPSRSEPPRDSSSLLVLCAQGDGVGPAGLLSLPGGAQLLVNAPEGCARLALEHRVRPTGRLRAVLLTHLRPDAAVRPLRCLHRFSLCRPDAAAHAPAQAGLPALLLRLAADGHGDVEVVGPPGVGDYLAAAHGFVKWVHPRVTVTELAPGHAGVCYEDAGAAACPLWSEEVGDGGEEVEAEAQAQAQARARAQRAAFCALCALRTAFPQRQPRRPAGGAEPQQAAARKRRFGAPRRDSASFASSSSDSDSDSGAEQPCAPPPAPPPLPRTLGRPLAPTHGGDGRRCVPGCGCAEQPVRAPGPNPLYLRPPSHSSAAGVSASNGVAPSSRRLVGYALLLRALDETLLVLDEPDDVATWPKGQRLCGASRCCSRAKSHPPVSLSCWFGGAAAGSGRAHAAAQSAAAQLQCRGEEGALCYLASFKTSVRLHAAAPGLFPLPHGSDATLPPAAEEEEAAAGGDVTPRGVLLLRALFQGGGRPPLLDRSGCPPLRPDARVLRADLLLRRPTLRALLAKAAAAQAAAPARGAAPSGGNAAAAAALRARLRPSVIPLIPIPPPAPIPAPDVLFLGTGCAEPSKHRGAAAILLRIPSHGCLLLDAGEGCSGAITRALGSAAASAVFAAMRVVVLSHQHADHMLGLPGMLARCAAPSGACSPVAGPPVLVIGPSTAASWLAGMPAGSERPAFSFLPTAALQARPGAPPLLPAAAAAAFCALGLARVTAVAVSHCKEAFAFVLAHCSGWSVAYSGDCRPSDAFAVAGRGCTLLIHEATFEDGLQSHALAKRHCTTAEALSVAQRMQPRHTVLTHFSQRYPKAVLIDEAFSGSTSIAFDGMRVCLTDLPDAATLAPIIAAALEEGEDEEPDDGANADR